MNKWLGIGRLTADPTVRYSQGDKQTAIANFTLAVDRRFKRDGDASADFIRCVAIGKIGETVEKYCRKGKKISVEGRIQTGSYEKDGVKHYTTDIYVEAMEFVESRAAESQNSDNNELPASGGYTPPSNSTGGIPVGDDGFLTIPDGLEEELPFN